MIKASLKYIFLDNWLPKVICVVLAIILALFYHLDTIEERSMMVPLGIDLPPDLVVTGDFPKQVRVVVKGQGDLIFTASEESVRARVDLTHLKEPGVFTVKIECSADEYLRKYIGLEAVPSSLSLTLEERVQRSVNIIPRLSQALPRGYRLVSTYVNPTEVTIEGSASALEGVEELYTVSVDLSQRISDFTVALTLEELGEGILIKEDAMAVEFGAVIEKVVVSKSYNYLELAVRGLSPPLRALPYNGSTRLEVRGEQLTLDRLTSRDLGFYVDASSIQRPGSYTLPVELSLPLGVELLNYFPLEAEIEVAAMGEGQ